MFIYYQPNPAHRMTGDCAIRAVAKALNTDWDTAYMWLTAYGFRIKDWGNHNAVLHALLRAHGFTRHIIPDTCPDCYTVRDFAADNPFGVYVLCTGSHVVTVEEGAYYDSWDSGDEVPAYYWRLE